MSASIIGHAYEKGLHGHEKDYVKAREAFKKSSALGEVPPHPPHPPPSPPHTHTHHPHAHHHCCHRAPPHPPPSARHHTHHHRSTTTTTPTHPLLQVHHAEASLARLGRLIALECPLISQHVVIHGLTRESVDALGLALGDPEAYNYLSAFVLSFNFACGRYRIRLHGAEDAFFGDVEAVKTIQVSPEFLRVEMVELSEVRARLQCPAAVPGCSARLQRPAAVPAGSKSVYQRWYTTCVVMLCCVCGHSTSTLPSHQHRATRVTPRASAGRDTVSSTARPGLRPPHHTTPQIRAALQGGIVEVATLSARERLTNHASPLAKRVSVAR